MAGGIRWGGSRDSRFVGETDKDNDEKRLLCPHCKVGLLVGPEQYKSCEYCHRTGIPAYEGKTDSELESFIEPSDSPWGPNAYAISLDDPKLSNRGPIRIKERDLNWRPGDDDE
jgi:hypothetical protein